MRKKTLIVKVLLLSFMSIAFIGNISAQTDDGLKITGYIQSQVEYAGKDALQVWTGSYDKEKYNGNDHFLTYGVRRGRMRFTYDKNRAKAVIELNVSENGVSPFKAYLGWQPTKWLSFQAGLLNSFFGDELMYLSPLQETMDRTVLTHKLFPGLHEVGLKAILTAPKESLFNGLKLELAAVSGNGINKTPDGRINFESHLKYNQTALDGFMKYGIGISYYNGRVNNAADEYNFFKDGVWHSQFTEKNQKLKREYFGIDGQLTLNNDWGKSNIRAEYITGVQPSLKDDFTAPKNNQYDSQKAFSYKRNFNGYYIYYVQNIAHTNWQTVLKAARYDFNSDANGDNAKYKMDLAYQNYGIGVIFNATKNVRLSAFYDWYINEETENIAGYNKQVPNDVLTVRMQVSF